MSKVAKKHKTYPKGYWEANISLDRLFDSLLLMKCISRETYDEAQGMVLKDQYLIPFVKKIAR